MKPRSLPHIASTFRTLASAGLCLIPAIASAHPGHFHPEETDEFDALRTNFLHLHGNLEIGLASLALIATLVFNLNRNRSVRLAAAITAGGSLVFLATH